MASDSRLPSSLPTPPNNPLLSSDSPPPLPNPENSHCDPNPGLGSKCPPSNPLPIPRPYPPTQPLYYGGGPHYSSPPPPYHPGLPVPYWPPPPPIYPTYHDPDDNKSNTYNCLCRIILIATALTIFFFVVGFILQTLARTELPSISVTHASVNSFTIAPSPFYFTPDFNLTFSLINPSKRSSLTYIMFKAAVSYGDVIVAGWTPQRGFEQEKRTEVSKRTRVISVDISLEGPDVERMDDEMKRSGGLVEFVGRVRAELSSSKTDWGASRMVDVFCPGLKVEFIDGMTTSGEVMGTPTSCILR